MAEAGSIVDSSHCPAARRKCKPPRHQEHQEERRVASRAVNSHRLGSVGHDVGAWDRGRPARWHGAGALEGGRAARGPSEVATCTFTVNRSRKSCARRPVWIRTAAAAGRRRSRTSWPQRFRRTRAGSPHAVARCRRGSRRAARHRPSRAPRARRRCRGAPGPQPRTSPRRRGEIRADLHVGDLDPPGAACAVWTRP